MRRSREKLVTKEEVFTNKGINSIYEIIESPTKTSRPHKRTESIEYKKQPIVEEKDQGDQPDNYKPPEEPSPEYEQKSQSIEIIPINQPYVEQKMIIREKTIENIPIQAKRITVSKDNLYKTK